MLRFMTEREGFATFFQFMSVQWFESFFISSKQSRHLGRQALPVPYHPGASIIETRHR